MRINKRFLSIAKQTKQSRADDENQESGVGSQVRDAEKSVPSFYDATQRANEDETSSPQRSITKKTSQLPITSKLLYHIDFYSSQPIVSVTVVAIFALMIVLGIILGFPKTWVITFEIAVSIVTLLMVFTIQHTQGREQVATQRKLDELLRATPGAAESLMMLEEAPREFMMQVEDFQRDVRADILDENETGAP